MMPLSQLSEDNLLRLAHAAPLSRLDSMIKAGSGKRLTYAGLTA